MYKSVVNVNIVPNGRYVVNNQITIDDITITPETILLVKTINKKEQTFSFRFYNQQLRQWIRITMNAQTINAANLTDIQ